MALSKPKPKSSASALSAYKASNNTPIGSTGFTMADVTRAKNMATTPTPAKPQSSASALSAYKANGANNTPIGNTSFTMADVTRAKNMANASQPANDGAMWTVKPEEPKNPTLWDYLQSDSDFISKTADSEKAYQTALAGIANERSNYHADTSTSLFDKGLDINPNLRDENGIFRTSDFLGGVSWNPNDRSRDFGRTLSSLNNNAAARGMMNSSGYADSVNTHRQSYDDVLQRALQAIIQSDNGFEQSTIGASDTRNAALNAAINIGAAGYAKQYGVAQGGLTGDVTAATNRYWEQLNGHW